MKLDKLDTKDLIQKLNDAPAEQKSAVIVDAIAKINEQSNEELVQRIQAEAQQAKADEEYRAKLGLRTLTQKETKFYQQMIMDPKQSLTADQIDIIPTTIIDRTLDELHRESGLLNKLVRFAPAGVSKWISASYTGKAQWGALDSKIVSELNATIKSFNIELGKLTAFLVIPKSIRKLALPFVDRYFMAVLAQSMKEGLEDGAVNGRGPTANQPVGLFYKLNSYTQEGTASEKTYETTVTGFSPIEMAPVMKTLTKNGEREVDKVYLICNPEEYYTYVCPALYFRDQNGKFVSSTFLPIEPIPTIACAKGKGGFAIDDHYDMGLDGVEINEYKETKAIEDADLLIAKAHANGLATDNDVCYCFNPQKLVPIYKPTPAVPAASVMSLPPQQDEPAGTESQQEPAPETKKETSKK